MTNTLEKIMHNGDEYMLPRQKALVITLTSAGWTNNEQTVTATGASASNTVIASPVPASISDYADAGIYCSAQGTDSLTFTCDSTPASDIDVNVLVLSAEAGSTPTPPGPWQPGANTLVYFPFDTDMNDYSGNSRAMTTYGTINLSTSAPNIGTALYISNGSMNSGQFTSNTSLTISGWIYQTQAPLYDNAQVFGFSIDASGGGPSGCNFLYANSNASSAISNKPGLAFFNWDPERGSSAYNISNNTWYHCVAVYDKDTGKTKMYINGQYYTEYTSGRNDSQFYRCISRANGINRSFYGYMSELIGESKARTAQEISDYYNQTKANYGIS